jgi:hypothetical protein
MEDEVGAACGTYGGEKRNSHRIWSGNVKEEDHLENLDVDGRLKVNGSQRSMVGDLGLD